MITLFILVTVVTPVTLESDHRIQGYQSDRSDLSLPLCGVPSAYNPSWKRLQAVARRRLSVNEERSGTAILMRESGEGGRRLPAAPRAIAPRGDEKVVESASIPTPNPALSDRGLWMRKTEARRNPGPLILGQRFLKAVLYPATAWLKFRIPSTKEAE